jgi:hypothetical protein
LVPVIVIQVIVEADVPPSDCVKEDETGISEDNSRRLVLSEELSPQEVTTANSNVSTQM